MRGLGEASPKILFSSDLFWFHEEKILRVIRGGLQGVAANLLSFHPGVFSDAIGNLLHGHQHHHLGIIGLGSGFSRSPLYVS